MDYIEQGKLSVAGVKFFVLDEADRLLDTGSQVI
jgi:ATP-dependent RNA helicase DDX1